MPSHDTIAIVGAGIGGISAADALRRGGYAGRIVLVDAESTEPYDRPPLSKELLTAAQLSDPPALRPPQWYRDNRIDRVLGQAAERLEPAAHELHLRSGATIRYDSLLIATGSSARTLPALERGPLPCFYLRTFADALRIREHLSARQRVVVVGAGVIGLEVAASAVTCGSEVTVVEVADRVMARTMIPSVSSYIERYHRDKGVSFHLGARITGQASDGTSRGLELHDRRIVPADVIVVGVGIVPNVALAERAGLACENGIVVDEYGATSAPGVFAAGDVAHYPDSFYGKRVRCENWMHAEKHASTVARNMLGERIAYKQVPFMWSDQFDLKIQVTGVFDAESHVVRGSMDSHAFIAFHLRNGRLVGATGINQPRDITITQKLIEAGTAVDPQKLADAKFNLRNAIPK